MEYKGIRLDCGYRLGIVVEGSVILELKCVEALLPIHQAQLLSYLRRARLRLGLLLNFHVYQLRQGEIKRLRNDPQE